MRTFLLSSFLIAATALASAASGNAQGSLTGPSLGLVYDAPSHAIRRVTGVPGAATTGKPIGAGFFIRTAAIAPSQAWALAISTEGNLNLLAFSGTNVTASPIATSGAPERIVLSPTGAAALLYFRTSQTIQAVTGLPASPQLSSPISLSSLPTAPGAFAISDDGQVILAGLGQQGFTGRPPRPRPFHEPRSALFAISRDGGQTRSIASLNVAAIAFLAGTHDAVVADETANSVTLIRDAGGQSTVAWTFHDGRLLAPDSVAASADGKAVIAASSTHSTIAILDGGGANPVFISCRCAPKELRPLGPAGVYELTESSDGLVWILDSNPAAPRVLFVPAASDAANAAGGGE